MTTNDEADEDKWDVIVIDGTWSQAQKAIFTIYPLEDGWRTNQHAA
jgi:DTW domain-containing protein YfiP